MCNVCFHLLFLGRKYNFHTHIYIYHYYVNNKLTKNVGGYDLVHAFLYCSGIGLWYEFSSHVHKFMAHLMDPQYKTVGHKVLYVPDEGLKMQDPLAHKDKELMYRLEGEISTAR